MNFANEAHKAGYEKIAAYMKDLFGEFARPLPDKPMFGLAMGSALAQVAVLPWRDDETVVSVRSYVVTGAELKPDLLKFLLEKNNEMRFGGFGVDSDGDIFFTHSVVGSTCDKVELRTSVMAVVSTADELDDEIISRWGGRRALDMAR